MNLDLTVNNFETLTSTPSACNEIPKKKKIIEALIRTDHLSFYDKSKLFETVTKNHNVLLKLNEKLTSTTTIKHEINTTDESPVYTKTYRYPHVYKQDGETQIRDMLDSGIIQPFTNPN